MPDNEIENQYTIKEVPPVSQGGVLSPHDQNACGTSYCQQQVSLQNQQVVIKTTQLQILL